MYCWFIAFTNMMESGEPPISNDCIWSTKL